MQSRAAERHWPEDTAAKYVGSYLKYAIDGPERESVAKFLTWAHELGLAPAGMAHWAEIPASLAASTPTPQATA